MVYDRGAQTRLHEQLSFRVAVGDHVWMIVQMIACEIGENREVEIHRRDPLLIQSVRGDLHHHVVGPCLSQRRQLGVNRQHVRGGQESGSKGSEDTVTQGAEQPAAGPLLRLTEPVGDVVTDGGFTIGPR